MSVHLQGQTLLRGRGGCSFFCTWFGKSVCIPRELSITLRETPPHSPLQTLCTVGSFPSRSLGLGLEVLFQVLPMHFTNCKASHFLLLCFQ